MRIGVVKEFAGEGYQAGVMQRFDEAVELLRELGAEVVEVSCPSFTYALPAYYLIAPSECSSNLARFDAMRYGLRVGDDGTHSAEEVTALTREAGFGAEVKRRIMLGTYALSSGYYDAYYGSAQKVRTLITRDFDRAFDEVDVLVSPTTPTTAFPIGERADDPMAMYLADLCTIPSNLAGNAAMSLPCGLAPEDGLPVGLQIIAPAMADDRLYRVGAAVEAAFIDTLGPPPARGGTDTVSGKLAKAKDFKKSKAGTYLSIGTTVFGTLSVVKQVTNGARRGRHPQAGRRGRARRRSSSPASACWPRELRAREQRRRPRRLTTRAEREVSVTVTDDLVSYEDALASYDPVMGLEVHVELGTKTKMFCGCSTELGAEPNTQTCPTCLGLPGSLPVVNAIGVESAIKIGLALNCEIAEWCRFARKNYFYPDMPKNFQTSQYDEPIAFNGYLDVAAGGRRDLPGRDRARPHGGGHRQVHPRRRRHRPYPRRLALAAGLQPGRHPADRDRHQADRRARATGPPRSPRRTSPSCASSSRRSASPRPGWSRARCAAT